MAQELKFSIVEVKGPVDIRYRDNEWEKASIETIVGSGTELFTGYHSQVTIEIGNNSYITVNQFTHIIIDKILVRKDEATTSLSLLRGYLVILSKPIGEFRNKISVMTKNGNVEFDDAGGEVYLRKDKGIVVKSFLGKINIGTKFSKIYFINKDEVCGILPGGRLISADYYLRQNINALPNNVNSPQDIQSFYQYISLPYTNELRTNDFHNHYEP